MAAPALTFESLRQQIRQKKLSPVYILHGKEGYYTDLLVKEFENVLPEGDKEFNQYILYAPQVEPGKVMDLCQRLPMMAERQVVILKEAQSVRADQINRLHRYVQNPSSSTVLVIVFRGDDAKGKELLAAAKAKGTIFESKEVRDYQIVPVISAYIKQKGLTADQKSMEMLRDNIGNDLSRIFNEVDKLVGLLPPGAAITPEAIERNIGISKEYNTFELVDALATKNAAKAMKIVDYFAANPKANPVQQVIGALFNFYSDLLICFYTKDKSDASLMQALNLKSSFPLRRFQAGMRCYNAYQLIEIMWAMRQFDVRSKGKGSRQDASMLFRELVYHILTAPGQLGV